MKARGVTLASGALALAITAACYDPVHLDAVATLGPEAFGVPEGPNHRPGQPCTTCHGADGPSSLELSVAGTLYAVRGGTTPLVGGAVTVIDARGVSRVLQSNEAGNFFVKRTDWAPAFPLRIVIEAEGVRREMVTYVSRDGGCAACHRDSGDRTFMPGVFLRDK